MALAFKDWEVVCEALGRGVQDVILRKGGIHEGRAGFSFAHEEFYLFPTLFHGQGEMVRGDMIDVSVREKSKWEIGDLVEVRYFCRVKEAVTLTSWEDVVALEGRHVWRKELIRERFDWAGKGMDAGSIHVAFVETEVLAEPLELVYEKGMGGCRSWVEI